MARHGLERVLVRNEFYRENYRYLSLLVFWLIILAVVLIGLIVYQQATWPKPKYFATTADGRPIPVVRLDVPYYEDPTAVMGWCKEAVISIYSLDYVTFRNTLQAAEVYFTTRGYQDFLSALKASTNLEAIKAKRQVVSVVVTGPPELTREGQLNPEVPYSWDVKMPVTLTYQNSEEEVIKQDGIVLVQVERTSMLRHKEGIAISQLVLQAN